MVGRRLAALLAPALALALALDMTSWAATPTQASTQRDRAGALIRLGVVDRFLSPNGDGRQDFARVTFVLGARAHVRALVRDEQGRTVHDESLGTLGASRHVWLGRRSQGVDRAARRHLHDRAA